MDFFKASDYAEDDTSTTGDLIGNAPIEPVVFVKKPAQAALRPAEADTASKTAVESAALEEPDFHAISSADNAASLDIAPHPLEGTQTSPASEQPSSLFAVQKDEETLALEEQLTAYRPLQGAEELPIYAYKRTIIDAVDRYPVTIITADTGTGKSTQIPQYMLETAHFVKFARNTAQPKGVLVTEPRKLAAQALADRVSAEVEYLADQCTDEGGGRRDGQDGFNPYMGVRVQSQTTLTHPTSSSSSSSPSITFVPDTSVLHLFRADPLLSAYSVVVVDEAHERTVHTDVLLGLLKQIVRKRGGSLRLVITSATADVPTLARHFKIDDIDLSSTDSRHEVPRPSLSGVQMLHGVAHIHCAGRTYPILTTYTTALEHDVVGLCVRTVRDIHLTQPRGHMLVFVAGREDVERVVESVTQELDRVHESGAVMDDVVVLPAHGGLSKQQLKRVFAPADEHIRKIVVATSIAETSLTIDGVVYVVDSGYTRERTLRKDTGVEMVATVPVSKSSAEQRKGRAGRTKPGRCYRLYPEHIYAGLDAQPVPEIQRTSLAPVLLLLASLGVTHPFSFSFIDPPPSTLLCHALLSLAYVGAVDSHGNLTGIGKLLATLPIPPSVGKFLLSGILFQCRNDALTIAAMLCIDNLFIMHDDHEQNKHNIAAPAKGRDAGSSRASYSTAAQAQHLTMHSRHGDVVTLLCVYELWRVSGYSAAWAREHYVNQHALSQARELRAQLDQLTRHWGIDELPSYVSQSNPSAFTSSREDYRHRQPDSRADRGDAHRHDRHARERSRDRQYRDRDPDRDHHSRLAGESQRDQRHDDRDAHPRDQRHRDAHPRDHSRHDRRGSQPDRSRSGRECDNGRGHGGDRDTGRESVMSADSAVYVLQSSLADMYRAEPERRYYDKYVANLVRARRAETTSTSSRSREARAARLEDIDSVYMCRVAHAMANAAHYIRYEGKDFSYRSVFDNTFSRDTLLHLAPTASLRALAAHAHPPEHCVYHACRVVGSGRLQMVWVSVAEPRWMEACVERVKKSSVVGMVGKGVVEVYMKERENEREIVRQERDRVDRERREMDQRAAEKDARESSADNASAPTSSSAQTTATSISTVPSSVSATAAPAPMGSPQVPSRDSNNTQAGSIDTSGLPQVPAPEAARLAKTEAARARFLARKSK